MSQLKFSLKSETCSLVVLISDTLVSKQFGCNKRLDLLTVDVLNGFYCIMKQQSSCCFANIINIVYGDLLQNKGLHVRGMRAFKM